MDTKEHWEEIYKSRSSDKVSWFAPHLNLSLELILNSTTSKDSKIIDVGGGASTLADDLINKGYENITILDISGDALKVSRKRLGVLSNSATWLEGNITEIKLPGQFYDLWHDRAVFHFLTSSQDRKKYVRNLNVSLKPKGTVIIATFSLKGPEKCSGLDVIRYDPETLQAELGKNYRLIKSKEEPHQTPSGTNQEFIYCMFKREE